MAQLKFIVDLPAIERGDTFGVIKSCIPHLKNRNCLDYIVTTFITYNKNTLHMDLNGVNDILTYDQYRVYYILTYIEACIDGQISPLPYYGKVLRSYRGIWSEKDDKSYNIHRNKIKFSGLPTDDTIWNLITYSKCFTLEQYKCLWFLPSPIMT